MIAIKKFFVNHARNISTKSHQILLSGFRVMDNGQEITNDPESSPCHCVSAR